MSANREYVLLDLELLGQGRVAGSSRHEGYEDLIELTGFSWGMSAKNAWKQVDGSGEAASRAFAQVESKALTVSKLQCNGSTRLYNAVSTGTPATKFDIIVRAQESVSPSEAGGRRPQLIVSVLGARFRSVGLDISGDNSVVDLQETFTVHFEHLQLVVYPYGLPHVPGVVSSGRLSFESDEDLTERSLNE